MRHLRLILAALPDRIVAARGQLFPFVPACLGSGIGLWFALPWEPAAPFYAAMAGLAVLSLLLGRWTGPALTPLIWALGWVCLGALAAGARAHLVAAPMLEQPFFGAVQGRIIDIDRSQTDSLRLTLDQVVLEGLDPAETPETLRLSLKGDQRWIDPMPGQVVLATARLAAPGGPVEPGGFDFRRMAFFDGLGAVGYTATPVVLWAEAAPYDTLIPRIRTTLSRAILSRVPGDAGAFASGVMTGDRSALSLQAVQDLRDSSLAHLLAISGMNLAFLVSFVFALVRRGLALWPYLALRVNSKKLAAAASLPVAAFYLLLSGSNVATERAFVMVCVALGAILIDRAALSLRTVAFAGAVVLVWQPEALLEPGFQMSFAATVALVAGFDLLARLVDRRRLWRGMPGLITLVLSSLIGGLATAPYAAAHFNRFADYGFLANLVTVPVMGAVVMPAGAVAALLAPLGLAEPALWVMGQGSAFILWVAHRVALIEGAVTGIPAAPTATLPLFTLGALFLVIWPFRERLLGLVAMALALGLWGAQPRPALLIDDSAAVLGLMGPEGRAISRKRGKGFTVTNWLENDGDLTDQAFAHARPGLVQTPQGLRFTLAGRAVLLRPPEAPLDCGGADLVILPGRLSGASRLPCAVIDLGLLARSGTLALYPEGTGVRLRPTYVARRLWTPPGAGGPIDLWLQ